MLEGASSMEIPPKNDRFFLGLLTFLAREPEVTLSEHEFPPVLNMIRKSLEEKEPIFNIISTVLYFAAMKCPAYMHAGISQLFEQLVGRIMSSGQNCEDVVLLIRVAMKIGNVSQQRNLLQLVLSNNDRGELEEELLYAASVYVRTVGQMSFDENSYGFASKIYNALFRSKYLSVAPVSSPNMQRLFLCLRDSLGSKEDQLTEKRLRTMAQHIKHLLTDTHCFNYVCSDLTLLNTREHAKKAIGNELLKHIDAILSSRNFALEKKIKILTDLNEKVRQFDAPSPKTNEKLTKVLCVANILARNSDGQMYKSFSALIQNLLSAPSFSFEGFFLLSHLASQIVNANSHHFFSDCLYSLLLQQNREEAFAAFIFTAVDRNLILNIVLFAKNAIVKILRSGKYESIFAVIYSLQLLAAHDSDTFNEIKKPVLFMLEKELLEKSLNRDVTLRLCQVLGEGGASHLYEWVASKHEPAAHRQVDMNRSNDSAGGQALPERRPHSLEEMTRLLTAFNERSMALPVSEKADTRFRNRILQHCDSDVGKLASLAKKLIAGQLSLPTLRLLQQLVLSALQQFNPGRTSSTENLVFFNDGFEAVRACEEAEESPTCVLLLELVRKFARVDAEGLPGPAVPKNSIFT